MRSDMTWQDFRIGLVHCLIAVGAGALGATSVPVVLVCCATALVSLLFFVKTWNAVQPCVSSVPVDTERSLAMEPTPAGFAPEYTPSGFAPTAFDHVTPREAAGVVATANIAIVRACRRADVPVTPFTCYVRGFNQAVADLCPEKMGTFAFEITTGEKPEITPTYAEKK